LPSGEAGWLRPETADPVDRYRLTDRVVIADQVTPDVTDAENDEALFIVTDEGRRAIAMAACFGPWPTVAEARCNRG
jgi:hypothetical protein